ncbi:MAG: disulfide bond formation protein B [Zoogloeaceae bacterium]|jgi:disulfide bond formation protein DsbB|nr:disulfide bond formation protein B [Zoogloeaceae bacterium]
MRRFAPLHVLLSLSPRPGFFLLGCAAVALVGAALVLQHWLNLNACPLCVFQRLLYMLFALLAFVGALLPGGLLARRTGRVFGVLLALVALSGFSVAIYQTMMQVRPDLVQECSYVNPGLIEQFVNWIGMYTLSNSTLAALFLATGLCSSQEWVFLGLSMANWSAVCFAALTVLALFWSRVFRHP